MIDLTKETVAAALDAKKFYLIGKPDLVAAKHHATLAELCRQQHEALDEVQRRLAFGRKRWSVTLFNQVSAALALWPDDPTEDSHE
jgi:hypothetical protein